VTLSHLLKESIEFCCETIFQHLCQVKATFGIGLISLKKSFLTNIYIDFFFHSLKKKKKKKKPKTAFWRKKIK
jgi:hypothetical protein